MLRKALNKKKKGFTLIELIIVIAIIAILSAVALPKFMEIRENSNQSSDIANGKTIATAVSTLVAEDKIVVTTGVITIQVQSGAASTTNEGKLESRLQSIPRMKTATHTTDTYVATVEPNGDVTVFAHPSTGANLELYPNPDAVFTN